MELPDHARETLRLVLVELGICVIGSLPVLLLLPSLPNALLIQAILTPLLMLVFMLATMGDYDGIDNLLGIGIGSVATAIVLCLLYWRVSDVELITAQVIGSIGVLVLFFLSYGIASSVVWWTDYGRAPLVASVYVMLSMLPVALLMTINYFLYRNKGPEYFTSAVFPGTFSLIGSEGARVTVPAEGTVTLISETPIGPQNVEVGVDQLLIRVLLAVFLFTLSFAILSYFIPRLLPGGKEDRTTRSLGVIASGAMSGVFALWSVSSSGNSSEFVSSITAGLSTVVGTFLGILFVAIGAYYFWVKIRALIWPRL